MVVRNALGCVLGAFGGVTVGLLCLEGYNVINGSPFAYQSLDIGPLPAHHKGYVLGLHDDCQLGEVKQLVFCCNCYFISSDFRVKSIYLGGD
eukprot:1370923-Ditylum_brightwellii.AAC.1